MKEYHMKTLTLIIPILMYLALSCNETTTGPVNEPNLLSNSTFDSSGIPSLRNWIVSDSSAVHFSSSVPLGGSGHTIVLQAQWFGPWPNNSIYQAVVAPAGTHIYRLSVFGKRTGVSGEVVVSRNRPTEGNSTNFILLSIADTAWTFYSRIEAVTATTNDSFFVTLSGGASERLAGTTFVNTCRLDKLN
jgi:hypothetical protein